MSQVSELLSSLIGKPVWGARRTNGSSFFIEVGSPHLEIREASSNPETRAQLPALARRRITPIGEFSILIIDGAWAILDEDIKTTDESELEEIDKTVNRLNGSYLIAVDEQTLPRIKTTLSFDSGMVLSVEPYDEAGEKDNWNIRLPDGSTWALCPDGSILM